MNDPGRKFILAVLLLVIFGIFTGLDKMSVEAYQDFALWVLGLYTTGNVVQKFVPTVGLRKQV